MVIICYCCFVAESVAARCDGAVAGACDGAVAVATGVVAARGSARGFC